VPCRAVPCRSGPCRSGPTRSRSIKSNEARASSMRHLVREGEPELPPGIRAAPSSGAPNLVHGWRPAVILNRS
jgi:hypothetical protein